MALGVNPRRRRRGRLLVAAALVLVAGVPLLEACRTPHADPAFRAEIAAAAPTAPAAFDRSRPLRWRLRATLPPGMREASDLASTPAGLVVTASRDTLTEDGAAVFRVGENWSLVQLLDWDGQGFLRVHAYGPRLVVPDGDAPFHLLPFLCGLDTDEFVFVGDAQGRLGRGDRELLPAAYHVFDTARLATGELVASTGAYPPEDAAYWSKRAAAALFVDDGPGRPWRRALEYPSHDSVGITRLTYLETLGDGALLAGVTSTLPLPGAVRITGLPAHPVVTPIDGISGETLRWASTVGQVFHLASEGDRAVLTRSVDGGRSFSFVVAGDVSGLAPVQGGFLAIVGGALVFSADGGTFEELAPALDSLRFTGSGLVSVPVVVHAGSVWAASPVTGEIFEAVAE